MFIILHLCFLPSVDLTIVTVNQLKLENAQIAIKAAYSARNLAAFGHLTSFDLLSLDPSHFH